VTAAASLPLARRRRMTIWTAGAAAIAGLVATPLLAILLALIEPALATWTHLARTTLPEILLNTAALALMVGLGTAAVGAVTGWVVTMSTFPGRRVLEWALILPLAMPGYLSAIGWAQLMAYDGVIQSSLRATFGWQRSDYWFPDIQSLWGVGFVLTFVLYPYVYLLARAAFLSQSVCALEAGRMLGRGPWANLFQVAIPLSRPAIAGGVALALMETLADFGTVQFYGVPTFTTAIYRTWFGGGDRVAAAQLAAMLLILVLAALYLERHARGNARYEHNSRRMRPITAIRLTGWRVAAAIVICAAPLLLGFVAPFAQLLWMAIQFGDPFLSPRVLSYALNSLTLAAAAALVTVALALFLAYSVRLSSQAGVRHLVRFAASGYALPGSVIAVGVLAPAVLLERGLDLVVGALTGIEPGPSVVAGTVGALIFAYVVRFLAIALQSVESGLARVTPAMDGAARTLGARPGRMLVRVHLPLVWTAVLAAAMLVFVDTLKELPATLLIRPFDFDTLAVRVFQMASDERLPQASTAAVAIVLVGLLPIVLMSRLMASSRPGDGPAP
jgi:iron(III) transport system permease protein